MPAEAEFSTRVCVLAPAPLVTVTVERPEDGHGEGDDAGDVHIHAGGQGFWIGRLVAELGHHVVLCATFGGEAGRVAHALVADTGLEVRPVFTKGTNGAYIHDRRSGERLQIAQMPPSPLSRHELDELYGATLVAALESEVCVLGAGSADSSPVEADFYGRLAADITANGRVVVADLSGEHLAAVVAGGATVVKVSHEELIADGRIEHGDDASLVRAMEELVAEGAGSAVVSRAEQPTLALVDGRPVTIAGPRLEPVDHRGAGDSLTAGLAAGLAHGFDLVEALRLGVAAGTINVTRRGLASGSRREIEHLAQAVDVSPLPVLGRAAN